MCLFIIIKVSGFRSKGESCEETEKCLVDTKKEFVSNILESKNKIDQLKKEVNAKNAKINQLELKL